MELMQLTPAAIKEQLTNLDRRRRDAGAKRRDTEQKLQNERLNLTCAESQRAELLPDLTHDDVAVNCWAANELDRIDSDILARKRLIEALEASLAKIVVEVDQVDREWKALDEAVEAQERAERFEQWKVTQAGRYATASELLDRVRLALGELCIGNREGAEAFGPQAHQFLTVEAEKFFRTQNSLDSRGFAPRYDFNFNQYQFVVVPMAIRKG
jgi:hypothetical protein